MMILKMNRILQINIKSMLLQVSGMIIGTAFLPPIFLTDNYIKVDVWIGILQCMCILLMLVIELTFCFKRILKCLPLYFLAAFGVILIIQRLYENNLSTALVFTTSIISIFLFFAVINSVITEEVLKGLVKYLTLVAWINAFSVFIFPYGLYNFGESRKYFFLGHINGAIKHYLPTWILLGYQQKNEKTDFLFWSTWAICFISLLKGKSYTALFGAGIFIAVYILVCSSEKKKWFMDGRIILACSFLLYKLVASNLLHNILYKLGEDVSRYQSIYIRFQILRQAKQAIRRSPWFGYGYLSNYARYIHLNNYYPSSSHNFFTDVMLNAGNIGLILFMFFLIVCMSKKMTIGIQKSAVFFAGMCSWGVMWNFEPYFVSIGMYLMMAIMGICWNGGFIRNGQSFNRGADI